MYNEFGGEILENRPDTSAPLELEMTSEAAALETTGEAAALELTSEAAALEDMDRIDSLEDMMDRLGLTDSEKEVYQKLAADMPEMTTEGFSGDVKVVGDCIHTTCSYTKTYFSCTYTSD